MDDRCVTERYIASVVGISQERVHSILKDDMGMRKLSAHWIPRLLPIDQQHTKQKMSHAILNHFVTDPDKFLLRFVTVDETWVHHFTSESKQQSKQWKHPGLTPAKADDPSARRL